MRRTAAVLAAALAVLVLVPAAGADDHSLVSTIGRWSKVIERDGNGLSAAAQQGTAAITRAARRLRTDSLTAERAVSAERATSATGTRVRRQTITALGEFADSGSELLLALRLTDTKPTESVKHSAAAVRLANAGERLLLATTKLLPKLRR